MLASVSSLSIDDHLSIVHCFDLKLLFATWQVFEGLYLLCFDQSFYICWVSQPWEYVWLSIELPNVVLNVFKLYSFMAHVNNRDVTLLAWWVSVSFIYIIFRNYVDLWMSLRLEDFIIALSLRVIPAVWALRASSQCLNVIFIDVTVAHYFLLTTFGLAFLSLRDLRGVTNLRCSVICLQ